MLFQQNVIVLFLLHLIIKLANQFWPTYIYIMSILIFDDFFQLFFRSAD